MTAESSAMNQQLSLTRSQKAAAILVAMGKPAAGRLLKFFKQEELRALMGGARLLRTIPQAELERVVAEFEAEFAEGAGLLDSADTMDTIFSETLTPEEMTALMNDEPTVAAAEEAIPVWPQLEQLEPERVGAFLESEHPQVAAFVLSNLASSFAAQVLLTLSKPQRGEIVKRMLALNPAAPEAAAIIENELRSKLIEDNSAKASSGGQVRVASVLNELDKSQLDEVMEDLEQAGGTNLEAIRAQLFAFEDVVLLDQKARVTLFDGIAADVVTLALRNADGALTEAILSALGVRARRMIESELKSDPGNASAADVARARKTIASTAIRLASQGLFALPQVQAAA
ncbi:MAG: flagellar motor switch protein FliG [Mesorhizobium sp.]|nr:flagellar motor switch protein FliG [Mesorhizobium sp.]